MESKPHPPRQQRRATAKKAAAALKHVIAAFADAGLLEASDLRRAAVLDRVVRITRQLPDLEAVNGHQAELLHLARKFRLDSQREYAILMYATWIEHTLNLVLQELAKTRSIGEAHIQAFLREGSVRAKSSWLFVLLGKQPPSHRIVSRIQRLADSRNSFIHYRWNRLSRQIQADLESVLNDAEPAVRGLQRIVRNTGLLSARSQVVRRAVRQYQSDFSEKADPEG